MNEPGDKIEINPLPEISELPDFDIQFEERPRSPACLIVTLLATPILLLCSLAVLGALVLFALQMMQHQP
jgi:hypothetical protein